MSIFLTTLAFLMLSTFLSHYSTKISLGLNSVLLGWPFFFHLWATLSMRDHLSRVNFGSWCVFIVVHQPDIDCSLRLTPLSVLHSEVSPEFSIDWQCLLCGLVWLLSCHPLPDSYFGILCVSGGYTVTLPDSCMLIEYIYDSFECLSLQTKWRNCSQLPKSFDGMR